MKAVEVWPRGHHEESTTNLFDWYYFVLFQDGENMLFVAYSILSSHLGKWDFMYGYHQDRIGQRGPTWVGHAHGPGSWGDLA